MNQRYGSFVGSVIAGSYVFQASLCALTRLGVGKSIECLSIYLSSRKLNQITLQLNLADEERFMSAHRLQVVDDLDEVNNRMDKRHTKPTGLPRLCTPLSTVKF